eukprot:439002-Amphidinium_carterae.1
MHCPSAVACDAGHSCAWKAEQDNLRKKGVTDCSHSATRRLQPEASWSAFVQLPGPEHKGKGDQSGVGAQSEKACFTKQEMGIKT